MSGINKSLSKIYRKIRHVNADIGNLWGSNDRFLQAARGARIVVYHGICEKDHTRYNNIFLTRSVFEEHLSYYAKYFHVISLDDYYERRLSEDRFNICISFDDGYENNYNYVLPLLEKYKMPAAFFITGARDAGFDILWNDFLGIISKHGPEKIRYREKEFRKNRLSQYISVTDKTRLADILRDGGFGPKAEMMESLYPLVPFRENSAEEEYWRLMTNEQIRKMSGSPWVTIGSHGYYHNDLARITVQEAEQEMNQCGEYLERITGKEIRSVAFPYGAYTREVVSVAKKNDFSQLLGLDLFFSEDHSDQALRERFVVNPFISTTNQMIATIKKSYV